MICLDLCLSILQIVVLTFVDSFNALLWPRLKTLTKTATFTVRSWGIGKLKIKSPL